ncbi:MAG: hypothetical protein ACOX1L_06475 [Erysipelotrichaceae bacterium]|jgi:hypothetical protein
MFVKIKKEDIIKNKLIYQEFSKISQPIPVRVARVDITGELNDCEDGYINYNAEELQIIDEESEKLQMKLEPFVITTEEKEYPDGWTLGDMAERSDEAPVVPFDWTLMKFVGEVTDVETKRGINPYTKDLMMGYFISIKTEDFSFVINANPNHSSMFEEFRNAKIEIPKVGDLVSGTANTTLVVLRKPSDEKIESYVSLNEELGKL